MKDVTPSDLVQILRELAEIKAVVNEMRSEIQSYRERIDRIERCLFGNGRLGVAQQVAIIVAFANFVLFLALNLAIEWFTK